MEKLMLFLLMCIYQWAYTQKEKDSIPYTEQNKAYDIYLKSTSKEGKWIAFFKVYDSNSDSLFIMNRLNPDKKYYRIKVLDHQWSRDKLILKYQNQTEIFDYHNGKNKILPACESIGTIEHENVLVLKTSDNVQIYDLSREEIIGRINNVINVFYVNNRIYLQIKENNKFQIIEWSEMKKNKLYSSSEQISNVVGAQVNSFLIFKKQKNKLNDIIYYNTKHQLEYKFSEVQPLQFNSATAYQRSDGRIVINAEKVKDKKSAETPEIWLTSDNNLIEKFKKSETTKFLWSPVEQNVKVMGTDKLNRVVDIGNKTYFLAFSFSELQDYTAKKVPAIVYRYNASSNQYDYIDTIRSNVNYSPDGNYLIYKHGQKWKLLDVNTMSYKYIGNLNFENAYFTDENNVYFDGPTGIWKYNSKLSKIKQVFTNNKGSCKILDFKNKSNFANYPFELSFYSKVLNELNYIFEVNDEASFTKSIFEKYADKYYQIADFTTSKMIYQKTDKAKNAYLFTEENFNKPKRIIDLSRASPKKVLFQSNANDKDQSKMKVETIKYKNREGVELKGILYYPLDVEAGKKYPMVVHVYQIQSDKINEYPLFLENSVDVGFSIRKLIEKGYFVYMPDIVFDKKGTGIAALDCVNKSIDALEYNELIDFNKMGLTGHSHGGYITNFIATHSDRFATYVSGAGNSDIVRSYFSLNEYFVSPFYWQFENGQYEMNTPFIMNKDLYFKNNPIYYVENVSKPMLLWTGKKDLNIEWGQIMEFYIGLKRNNKNATVLVYPDEGHTIISKNTAKDLHDKVLQWFGYYLKGEKKAEWMN
ncbi:prolyl oligopeptidase family serine peptidase [Chryseobacterium sp. C39-AII1]|uniref:alpha/beta hydrolase family protein n=1 Tax=Chryseobacterium sp. C39-AII1 TaxID=3080332 RepID=UPI003208F446